nr:glycosyltransferase [Oscillatoria sp. FACHB-1406]
MKDCEVCAIVPVRNEAETLPATLAALFEQKDFKGRTLNHKRYEVIVFANNCTDDSAEIVRRFARQHPEFALHLVERTLPPEEAYIGRVRQLLLDEAYRRLRFHPRGVIASTDGDTQVDSRWIAAIMREISHGADAIGGRIVVDAAGRAALDSHARASYLRAVGYHSLMTQLEDCIDPDPFDCAPRHYQFFGANFAVTCAMYARAGGMPLVRTPEDVAFREALVKAGARLRHSPLMRVTTSARQTGRTNLGLANQLSVWQNMGERGQAFLVEPVEAIEARLHAKRELRLLWERVAKGEPCCDRTVVQLAERFAIMPEQIKGAIARSGSFQAFYHYLKQAQHARGLWQQQWTAVNIEVAIADLRLRLNDFRLNGANGQIGRFLLPN